jgi:hypothetical protein
MGKYTLFSLNIAWNKPYNIKYENSVLLPFLCKLIFIFVCSGIIQTPLLKDNYSMLIYFKFNFPYRWCIANKQV